MPFTVPTDHLGLYVHVPYCARKCRYCDFPSGVPCGEDAITRYLDALAREAKVRLREVDRPVHTIFIGGGTPTLLSPEQLRQLWDAAVAPFPRQPDAEISIEANPGTLTPAHARVLAALPVTRVSLGVQSFDREELRLLGRIHTPEEAETAVALLRKAGISQINLDLMYALPGQTVATWEATLTRALALAPNHLSCYALMLEEETPLTAAVSAGLLPTPREEEEIAMTAVTAARLDARGYTRYEVSNYARDGAVCRHNVGYWLERDYLGLGPAAVSTLGGLRWRNAGEADYVARLLAGTSAVCHVERLAAPRRLLERVMLGLRLTEGFDLAEAEAACGNTLAALAGNTLTTLIADGWLEQSGTRLRLTPAGFSLANTVVTQLMAAVEPDR